MAELLSFAADPAARWVRPRSFRVDHVELAVTIDLAARSAIGEVRHHCSWIGAALGSVTFDRRDVEVLGATVDGLETAFSCGADDVQVVVPVAAAGDRLVIGLRFKAVEPRKGLYFIPAADGQVAMAWTQGAMEDHSHWFPCFDSPNNFSTFRISIRHQARFQAIAGGVREVCTVAQEDGGWTTSVFVQDRPHVLYLLNVVVGDLAAVEDPTCPVPVTHWLPRGREACAPAVFRATGFALRELAEFIGVAYPWQRYGHVVVHGFMWGGMENTTLTTITDRVLMTPDEQLREDVDCDSLIIHELVHQWFGDLLTMKSWSDIWLNESFATYLEARITAKWRASQGVEAETDALQRELWHNRAAYLEQHGSRYQRALVTNRWDDAYELFDRVAYEQGSLVLHTLCCWLGEVRFHAALKLYTERHRHDLVETADLRQAIEDATGEPVDWFFDQWVTRAGHPHLTVRWSHDPARNQVSVTIEQSEPLYRLPLTIAAAGLPEQMVLVEQKRQVFILSATTAPAWLCVDPRGAVLATWDEEHSSTALAALIADSGAAAHARARACVVAATKHPTSAVREAIAAAAVNGPELVREQAITTLAAWRVAEPLLDLYPRLTAERHRRLVAVALGSFRGDHAASRIADCLITWADASASGATAGDLLAARGALEHPGITPLLRARLSRPSWNQRLAIGAVRGLGASGEPAALDEVLDLLGKPDLAEVLVVAAMAAAGALGARLPLARERTRRALEPRLRGATLAVRVGAARALATLADPAAREALRQQRERETFGNVRRALREALHQLDQVAASTIATATLSRRIDDLEQVKSRLEARLDALEKRLG